MSAARRRGAACAGFTLIETLVALAVVAAVSVALQRGVVSTRQALGRAEAVTAAEAVARDILENRLAELAPAAGTLRGEDRGLAFAVISEPLDLPFPEPAPYEPQAAQPSPGAGAKASEQADKPVGRWAPLRVTIRVEPSSGPAFVVETIHVAPEP